MADLSRALVAKRGWDLISKPNSIWAQALFAKYCRGNSFLNASPQLGASWAWHSILQNKDLVAVGFCWRIRDGKSVNLWCELWIPDIPDFLPKLKEGAPVNRHLNWVSDRINPQFHCWKENLIRELFEHSAAEAILNISLPSSPQQDVPRWILHSKGTYSVKAAYLHDQKDKLLATGHFQSHDWRKIWKLKIQY